MRKIFITLLTYSFLFMNISNASENNWSFYTGMFDFSDEGKKSNLFGVQHINTEDSYFGTLQSVTGAMITADNATYFYKGFQIQNGDGAFKFTPSFTPGLYFEGDGKDLGHVIEFKTELQISFEISSNSELGFSYNHISNASLGDKNPGANSYMFNFLKNF